MIITLGGHHGAGKSTLGARLADALGYKRYSTGDFMRAIATERGISLIELGKEAEHDGGIIDALLDDRQKKIGEDEDDFIIDGRLAFHFIPHAVKIFLTVTPEEAARRIFADETRAGIEHHESFDDTVENIKIRRANEDKRFLKYYGIHIYDMSLYDIVIDTSDKTPNEVFDTALNAIHAKRLF
jgi:predicted cytidylate kinase